MVKINERYDNIVSQDPAYQGSKPVDAVNEFMSKFIGQPIKKKLESKEQALLEAGELIAKPFSFLGKQISSPDVTIQDLQKTATTDPGLTGLAAQVQVPFEALGETLQFIFDPQFYSDLRGKINRGEATGFERGLGVVSALGEIAGGDELLRFAVKKFGPNIKTFFDNLSPEEKADPIAVINKMPISKQQKVELGQEILGGGKTVENIQETIMRSPADEGAGGSSTYQKLTEEGKYNPTSAFGEKMQKDIEKKNKKFQLLEEYYTNNPADKTESAIKVRQNLKNLLPEGETLIKDVDIQQYARDNPNTALGKAVKPPKVPRAEQLTEDKFSLLQQEFNETGEKLNLLQASELVNIPYNTFRRLSMENEELAKLVGPKPIVGRADTLFHSYFPTKGKNSSLEKQAQYTIIRDMYRANGLGNNTKEFEAFMKELGFVPNKLKTTVNGKVEYKINPDYNLDDMTKRREEFFNKVIKPTYFKEPGSYEEYLNKLTHRNELTDYSIKKFIDTVKNNPAFQEQFVKEYRKKYKDSDILNDVEAMAYDFAAKNFNAQMAHIMPIDLTKAKTPKGDGTFKLAPNLEGMMFQSPFINVNYAAHNIGTQRKFENIIRKSLSQIKNGKNVEQNLNKLIDVNNAMTERGLQTYLRFTDKQMPESAFKLLQAKLGNKVQVEPEVAGVKSIFLGDRGFTLQENINFFNDRMQNYINNPQDFKISNALPKTDPDKVDEMFIKGSAPYIGEGKPTNFEKGGPVKMAKGGMDSILQNINQQNFTPDPAIDGDSAFQQAVKSGNLTALNIPKVFKVLGDTFGVFTPKRSSAPTSTIAESVDAGTALGAPPGQTLPATKPLQSEDFVFESFTLDKINSPTAPKAAKPQDWINYLQGGKDKAPSAELLDSGLFQYMADFEKFFPGQKMTKQQIVELYEQSPIANLKIKIKSMGNAPSPYEDAQQVMGTTRHKNAGNARIDQGGTDYREIVLEAGALPGEQKPYVNSTHFNEDNVLVFSRVANYDNKAGEQVAVIQELQTDLLTKVRKEQERLNSIIENKKLQIQKNNDILQNPNRDDFDRNTAEQSLTRLVPELNQLEKVKETNLISPYPMTVAKDLIPTYQKQLNDVQQEINTLMRAGIDRSDPEFLMKISELEAQQQKVLDDLLNLNRTSNFDELTKGIKVPATGDSEDLANIAIGRDNYASMKDLETFPPIPFNKQPDYVDLIIKATIKDAEARGINKVAIMPADVGANPRWNKTTLQMDREDKSSGDKFRNLYDKVGVQQLKNIAKKYGGQLNIEEIIDPQKSNLGLKFSTRNIEGDGFNFMKEVDVDQGAISRGDLGPANRFLNEEILRIAQEMEPNEVVYRKETAPGQTMDYFVKIVPDQLTGVDNFDLVPLKAGDRPVDAKILIEDRDPSAVKMYTIPLPEKTKDKPFFLFRKKEGGKIPGDRLVSITDIYGDY